MATKILHTDKAPSAIGPYSQGIIANSFLFTAGQIAIDPATNQVIADDVAKQTERVMANLAAILDAAGANWSHVVKTTVYLHDMCSGISQESEQRMLDLVRPEPEVRV